MLIQTAILIQLRQLLVSYNLQAYIVPAGDSHYTEFVADCQQRRAFISGFTGSAGTAIVSNDAALLWTDGRYFLQAEQQLNPKSWTLMKDGQPGVPSQTQWLKTNLTAGARVGVDPTLYTKRQWDSLEQELKSVGKSLVAVTENLVDKIWDDRPSCESSVPIINLGLEFAGIKTKDKVANVRKEMKANGAFALLITELDEVAWLLNLRGSDIPYSSTFFSYVLLTNSTMDFFVNRNQASNVVSTLRENVPEIVLQDYSAVVDVLNQTINTLKTPGKIWFNPNANYALVKLIPAERQLMKLTPIALMKAVKNPTEVLGYKNALIRDSAAICEFFAWLEMEMDKGERITEISAAEQLHYFRSQRDHFFNDSFPTISAAGENGAIIHYMPTPETDREIKRTDMYLLDSGGLYMDGTTDITRTIHLGSPSDHQKNCYTRVLKGQMGLTRAIFPLRMTGQRLDSFARQFLWEAGLDYNHGTGHGVGSFLNVHEGPFGIGGGYNSQDPGMRENFFTSNEPGYYQDGAFGIRLENIIRVRNVSLENNFQNRGFLGFEDVTFVPYDHKLIDVSLLSEDELKYLNDYQDKIRQHVGSYMRKHNLSKEALDWMMRATVPLSVDESEPATTTTVKPNPTTTDSAGNRLMVDILISSTVLLNLLKLFD